MFRNLVIMLAMGTLFALTDATASAAKPHDSIGVASGTASTAKPHQAAAARNAVANRHRRGMLHISVRNTRGRAAGGALVRIRAGNHLIVRRAGRGGHLNVAVRARSVVVHARGKGGGVGSARAAVVAGGHASVMIQLHGGRTGAAASSLVARRLAHRHQARGLGLHGSIHRSTSNTTPKPSVHPDTATGHGPAVQ
jgi:hypothetical protein